MITTDTSALLTLLIRNDSDHRRVLEAANAERPPIVIPSGVMGELAYLIEARAGIPALNQLLADIASGSYVMDCSPVDIPRIRTLVTRYQDLPLGYVDASVIACAERHGGRVLTLDHRHFGVVAWEGMIAVVPEPA